MRVSEPVILSREDWNSVTKENAALEDALKKSNLALCNAEERITQLEGVLNKIANTDGNIPTEHAGALFALMIRKAREAIAKGE